MVKVQFYLIKQKMWFYTAENVVLYGRKCGFIRQKMWFYTAENVFLNGKCGFKRQMWFYTAGAGHTTAPKALSRTTSQYSFNLRHALYGILMATPFAVRHAVYGILMATPFNLRHAVYDILMATPFAVRHAVYGIPMATPFAVRGEVCLLLVVFVRILAFPHKKRYLIRYFHVTNRIMWEFGFKAVCVCVCVCKCV